MILKMGAGTRVHFSSFIKNIFDENKNYALKK
jgi:hypothetical protein